MKKKLFCLAALALALLFCAGAYANCLELPAGLRVIESEAFYGDASLEEVVVPEGAAEIGSLAFADSGLKRIVIPDSVQAIAEDAFDGTDGLTIVSTSYSYAKEYASLHPEISWESNDPIIDVTPDMPLTRENVLSLLDAIDPDGAFIIRNSSESFFSFWFGSATTIGEGLDSLDTAVHEQCHDYTHTSSGFMYSSIQGRYMSGREWIYIGNGEHIEVTFTDIFPSSELVDTIPESLRTDRFGTYINGDANTSSIQHGPYGMLNEFTAYCWGIHNTIKQQGFRQEHNLLNLYRYSDDFVSYAEFRYYILHYMLYAKEHYPTVYSDILANDNFRKAFATIDNLFAGFAESQKNYVFLDQWNALMNEMEKTEYMKMANLLKK